MIEWKMTTISEVADLIAGFAFKSKDFGDFQNKVIKIKDITPPTFDISGADGVKLNSYSPDRLQKYKISYGDYVLAMTGATIGKVGRYISNQDAYINQRVLKFCPNSQKCNKDFLYYTLMTPDFLPFILNHIDSQSVQPNISASSVGKFQFLLPPLEKQHQIALILSSLDDKIELNAQINHNLEEQAKAIFKSWFVDFEPFRDGEFVDSEFGMIPAGWRIGALSEIADITMGQSPKGSSYNEDSVGTVFYQGRAEFTDRFPAHRLFTTEPKRMAEKGDVLLSVRAPVGDMNIANESCCIGRGLAAIHAKKAFSSFVFYTMQALKPELDKYNGEGTVFGCVNKDALNTQKVIIPPDKIISEFEKIASSLDQAYLVGFEGNMRLAQLRDALLPKLMSGEIDVSEVEI